jgi:ferredoxin--NADP+ reductase
MPHVIVSELCTKDCLCIESCPTDCIHPGEDDERFEAAESLFIDPNECADCAACVDVCPTEAIFAEEDLPDEYQAAIEKNAAFFN